MQRFSSDLNAIEVFTQPVNLKHSSLTCKNCLKKNQLVSHGFVYKWRSTNKKEVVGKRVLCSKRYGQSGCGKTMIFYVAKVIPRFRYTAVKLFTFLSLLLQNSSVEKAYQAITDKPVASRNAWRWLNRLNHQQVDFRAFLKSPAKIATSQFNLRCKRLQLLLPVIHRLFYQLHACPCACYQVQAQAAFL